MTKAPDDENDEKDTRGLLL